MTRGQKVLKLASLLLGYPDEAMGQLLPECESALRGLPPCDGRSLLGRFLRELRAMRGPEREHHYVELFDFRQENALYLTFHEAGEGRERAQLLLALKEIVRASGFEAPEQELPDYLPLLLELLAVRPRAKDDLALRVSRRAQELERNLEQARSPYRFLFAAVRTVLPQAAERGDGPPAGAARSAGEDDVPYPLHHAQS